MVSVSTLYKSQIVSLTDNLIVKALINSSVEVTNLNKTTYPDSITIEINLPPDMVVTRIDFLDDDNNIITSITGIEIDTAVTTVFSHNIQFVQGGA